jgi:hypothetical protein
MRHVAFALAALGLVCVLAPTGRAGGDEAKAIIDKAIKAHFPKGLDTKNKGLRTQSKGTVHVQGLDLAYTSQTAMQLPTKFKEVVELTVMGKQVTVTSVFNGKEAWIKANDMEIKVEKEILDEFKDAAYSMGMVQGLFLKDKTLKFSLIGEVQVKGKPAVGVKITREGKKDISLYFDKGTGLITKVEMRKRDLMSGQEVTEERIITEYQDVADRKVARKVEVVRDGKNYLEAEITDVQILDSVDDAEFVRPQ